MNDRKPGVEHVKGPVVPNATHSVECACGAAFDVKAASQREAVEQITKRHLHPGAQLLAQEIKA